MAIRSEELLAAPDAAIYRFPVRCVGAAARRRRMRVRRRRAAVVATALGLIVMFLLATGPGGSVPASSPSAPRAVTVGEGETLWAIAEAHAPGGVDLRAYVDLLIELNRLEGAVRSGMRIRLPK